MWRVCVVFGELKLKDEDGLFGGWFVWRMVWLEDGLFGGWLLEDGLFGGWYIWMMIYLEDGLFGECFVRWLLLW